MTMGGFRVSAKHTWYKHGLNDDFNQYSSAVVIVTVNIYEGLPELYLIVRERLLIMHPLGSLDVDYRHFIWCVVLSRDIVLTFATYQSFAG